MLLTTGHGLELMLAELWFLRPAPWSTQVRECEDRCEKELHEYKGFRDCRPCCQPERLEEILAPYEAKSEWLCHQPASLPT